MLGDSKEIYNYCNQEKKLLSKSKWKIILLKYQRLISKEEKEDANKYETFEKN